MQPSSTGPYTVEPSIEVRCMMLDTIVVESCGSLIDKPRYLEVHGQLQVGLQVQNFGL